MLCVRLQYASSLDTHMAGPPITHGHQRVLSYPFTNAVVVVSLIAIVIACFEYEAATVVYKRSDQTTSLDLEFESQHLDRYAGKKFWKSLTPEQEQTLSQSVCTTSSYQDKKQRRTPPGQVR